MTTLTRAEIRASRPFRPSGALAKSIELDDHMMHVQLTDGRVISVPLIWFPLLRDATPEQRANYEIGAGGRGLHWPDIDEDLSVAGLMSGGDERAA